MSTGATKRLMVLRQRFLFHKRTYLCTFILPILWVNRARLHIGYTNYELWKDNIVSLNDDNHIGSVFIKVNRDVSSGP